MAVPVEMAQMAEMALVVALAAADLALVAVAVAAAVELGGSCFQSAPPTITRGQHRLPGALVAPVAPVGEQPVLAGRAMLRGKTEVMAQLAELAALEQRVERASLWT